MHLPTRFSILLALALTFVLAQDRVIDCYGINGFSYSNNTRCPGSNACCGVADECLSNRLCHRANDGPDTFVRGPCAIYPYDSGTCAQICLYNETTGILPRVRSCADGSLCCDNDERCCDNGDGIFLDINGIITDSQPSTTYTWGTERTASSFRMTTATPSTSLAITSGSLSTSAPTSVSTTVSTSTESTPVDLDNQRNSPDDDDDGNNLAIGLGVGLGIGIALLAGGLGVWFWRRRRRHGTHAQPSTSPNVPEKYQYAGQMPAEVPSNEVAKSELPSGPPPVELDGSSRH